MGEAIRVRGLAEFSRALRKMDADRSKQLRLALNESAGIIVDWAKPRVPVRTGAARRSLKAASTRTLARVSGGGSKAVYFGWLDFGGRVGRKNSVVREFRKHGRYIYQGYYANRNQFADVLESNLRRLARNAGLEVTRGG